MSKKTDIKKQNIIQLLLGLAIIALVNIIGSYYFTRIDLTSSNKYTLSPETIKLVKSFDDYVTFKVYLKGNFPAGFQKLQKETGEMLNEFKAYNSNIQYEFINPAKAGGENKNKFYRQLTRKGLEPTSIRTKQNNKRAQQRIFPGAIVTYKSNRKEAVELLESQMGKSSAKQIKASIQALEYNLASVLKKLASAKKDKIAFLHGHKELSKTHLKGAEEALSEFYNVKHLVLKNKVYSLLKRTYMDSAKEKLRIEPRFKAVIIAKPRKEFTEKEKFIIDQYVMHGGKLFGLIDPTFTNMDSLRAKPRTMAIPNDLNLDDQLFSYGVRLNRNLIKDMRSAKVPINIQPMGTKPKFKMFPWPYFPIMIPQSEHPIVKNLNGIRGKFTSTLDTIATPGIKKTILLQSSRYSRLMSMPHEINMRNIVRRRQNQRMYNQSYEDVAVLLEGNFKSVFKNRIPPEIKQSKAMAFRTESDSTQMIVVADGDIIRNSTATRRGNMKTLPLGVDKYTGQRYGNEDFIVNAVNYLCDDSGLLKTRTRDLKIRMLNKQKFREEKTKWQIINVLTPILIILIMSMLWNFIREKKYNRKQ